MNWRFVNVALATGVALVGVALQLSEANAGAFAIREQSASGQGMAFAGEGTSSMGLSAMFWNPAAVTQTEGLQGEAHATGIFPTIVIRTLPSTSQQLLTLGSSSVDIGRAALLGSLYTGYQHNDMYFGLVANAPFGLRSHAPIPWPGQNLSSNVKTKSLEGNLIAGYKFNDLISAAGGVRVISISGYLSQAFSPSATAPNPTDLDVSDIGLGWNAGITLRPSAGTEIAIGYRSAVNADLTGGIKLPDIAAPLSGSFGIKGKATLPDQANLGIRQNITDSITLLGTVEWQNWSRLQTIPFSFTTGPAANITATTLTFNYRDAWYFALGGEYRWDSQLLLRAGAGYEVTPIVDRIRDTSLPYNEGWRFSVGGTYQLSPSATVDFGYSYITVKDAPINVVSGHPDSRNLQFPSVGQLNFIGVTRQNYSIVSMAMRYKF